MQLLGGASGVLEFIAIISLSSITLKKTLNLAVNQLQLQTSQIWSLVQWSTR